MQTWGENTLAPGSKVVTRYLEQAGLQKYLDQLGSRSLAKMHHLHRNSGPLDEPISEAIQSGNLWVSAVLSGNRNFEGRVHPTPKPTACVSPLSRCLCLGGDNNAGSHPRPTWQRLQAVKPVYLPRSVAKYREVAEATEQVSREMFAKEYDADVLKATQHGKL